MPVLGGSGFRSVDCPFQACGCVKCGEAARTGSIGYDKRVWLRMLGGRVDNCKARDDVILEGNRSTKVMP